MDRVSLQFTGVVRWLERLLALAVLAGVVVYAAGSATVLAGMDWRTSDTFYELVYRVLLLVIGVELVRMLVVHELVAVLELLAFVIARKMLKPDLNSVDVLLVVIAFVALMGARRFLTAAPGANSPKAAGEDPSR